MFCIDISVHAGLYVVDVCMGCAFIVFYIVFLWKLLCTHGKTLLTSSYMSFDLFFKVRVDLLPLVDPRYTWENS